MKKFLFVLAGVAAIVVFGCFAALTAAFIWLLARDNWRHDKVDVNGKSTGSWPRVGSNAAVSLID